MDERRSYSIGGIILLITIILAVGIAYWLLNTSEPGAPTAAVTPTTTPSPTPTNQPAREGLRGTVKNQEGWGIGGAGVRLVAADGEVTSVANDSGDFLLPDWTDWSDAEDATLTASAPGYLRASRKVQAGGTSVDIVLSRGGTLAVHVKDATGTVIPGATVLATARDATRTKVSGDDGVATLSTLPPGRYTLTATTSAGLTGSASEAVFRADESLTRTIVVRAMDRLYGRVEDPDGTPVSAQILIHYPNGNIVESEAADDGAFTVMVPTGHIRIVAEKEGYSPSDPGAFRVTSPTDPLVLRLNRLLHLRGVVQNADGEPVPGAQIHHGSQRAMMVRVDSPAISDANGRFSIEVTTTGAERFTRHMGPPRRFRLLAVHPDYRDSLVEEAEPGDEDIVIEMSPGATVTGVVTLASTSAPVPGATVALSLGLHETPKEALTDSEGRYTLERVTPWRAHRLHAEKSGMGMARKTIETKDGETTTADITLEDPVTASGTVLEEGSDTPVPDALVFVESEDRRVAEARTDADGKFQLNNLPPWNYRIRAEKEGYRQVTTGIPGRQDQLEGPVEGHVVFMTRTGSVSGIVVDANTRAPVAGAEVRITPAGVSSFMKYNEFQGLESVTSAEDGTFTVANIYPIGELLATASHETYAFGMSETFGVKPGMETTEIVVEMSAGNSISGRVLVEGDQSPVEGASVSVQPMDMAVMALLQRDGFPNATSEADGAYTITGLPPASYRLRAEHEELGSGRHDAVEIRGGQDQNGADILIRLGESIAGTVVNEQEKPLEGINVQAQPTSFDNPEEFGRQGVQTDAEGHFEITNLKQASYHITADGPKYTLVRRPNVAVGTTDLKLTLLPAGNLSGRVVRAADGEPIPSFQIALEPRNSGGFPFMGMMFPGMRGQQSRGFENADGSFEFVDLDAGTYKLTATTEGLAPKTEDAVVVEAGESTNGLVIELDGEAKIEGRVVRAFDRQGVSGAEVRVSAGGALGMMQNMGLGDNEGTVRTDDAGHFTLGGLAEGRMTLRVNHPSFPPAKSEPIEVKAGEVTSNVIVVLSEGGAVQGHVYDAQSQPRSGQSVMTVIGQGEMMQTATTDSEGFYRIEGLMPGAAVVMLVNESMMRGQPQDMKTVVLKDGETEIVNFGMQGASVFGHVTQYGEPVSGMDVALISLESSHTSSVIVSGDRTNSQGEFRMEGVAPGDYVIQAGERMRAWFQAPYRAEINVPGNIGEVLHNITLEMATIEGLCVDAATQEPLASVKVVPELLELDETEAFQNDQYDAFSMFGASAVSGRNGRFRLEELRPGRYRLQAVLSGYALTVVDSVDAGGGAPAQVTIEMAGEGILEGRVLDADTARPLPGVTLRIFDSDGGLLPMEYQQNMTDSQGHFQISGLGGGVYELQAYATNYASRTIPGITVQTGGTTSREILLEPDPGELLLTVLEKDGTPIPDAKLGLVDSSGVPAHWAPGSMNAFEFRPYSNMEGRISWGLLAPGRYQATIESLHHETLRLPVTIEAGEMNTVTVILDAKS